MKKLLLIIPGIILFAIIVIVASALLLDPKLIQQAAISQVQTMTGREMRVSGEVKLRFFPWLSVEMNEVTLANAPWAAKTPMLQAKKIQLDLEIMPLLHKQAVVRSVRAQTPVVLVETSEKGQSNWEFSTAHVRNVRPNSDSIALISDAQAENEQAALRQSLEALQLQKLTVTDGTVQFSDHRTTARWKAEHVDIMAAFPGLDSPAKFELKTVWNGQKVEVNANVSKPGNALSKQSSPAKLELSSAALNAGFDGEISQASGAIVAKGKLTAHSSSLVEAAKWLGNPISAPGGQKLAFDLTTNADCTASQCNLTQTLVALDDIKGKGAAKTQWAGKLPAIQAELDFETLDVTPYMAESKHANLPLISEALAAEQARWSNAPLGLQGLNAANADVTIRAAKFLAKEWKMDGLQARLKLADGTANLIIPQAEFFSGKASLNAQVSATGALHASMNVQQMQAEPLLRAAANFERLTGTVNASADISSAGNSVAQWVARLSGNGKAQFRDGSIRGINIAEFIRNLQGKIDPTQAASGGGKTDFSELSASYTIANGVVHNDDLLLKAPLLRVGGAGDVNLPLWQLRYRVTPELVSTLEGQDGKQKSGLAIPVMLEGDIDHPSIRPDLTGALQNVLKDPKKLQDTIQSLGGKKPLKEGLQNLLR